MMQDVYVKSRPWVQSNACAAIVHKQSVLLPQRAITPAIATTSLRRRVLRSCCGMPVVDAL